MRLPPNLFYHDDTRQTSPAHPGGHYPEAGVPSRRVRKRLFVIRRVYRHHHPERCRRRYLCRVLCVTRHPRTLLPAECAAVKSSWIKMRRKGSPPLGAVKLFSNWTRQTLAHYSIIVKSCTQVLKHIRNEYNSGNRQSRLVSRFCSGT